MSDEKSPKWRETSFKPGNQAGLGNAGMRSKAVGDLARRYTVDAIRALVEVVRLPAVTHAGPKTTAAIKLLEIAHPGLGKGGPGAATDAARLHLLALQALAPPGSVPAPALEQDDGPALDAEALIGGGGDYSLLPQPDEDLPGEALPLWDLWKARKGMAAARDAELVDEASETEPREGDNGTESQ
jgi:hypothetical protein